MPARKSIQEKQLAGTLVKHREGRRIQGPKFTDSELPPFELTPMQEKNWYLLRDQFRANGLLSRINKPALDIIAVAYTQVAAKLLDKDDPGDIQIAPLFSMLEHFGCTPNSKQNFLPAMDKTSSAVDGLRAVIGNE